MIPDELVWFKNDTKLEIIFKARIKGLHTIYVVTAKCIHDSTKLAVNHVHVMKVKMKVNIMLKKKCA